MQRAVKKEKVQNQNTEVVAQETSIEVSQGLIALIINPNTIKRNAFKIFAILFMKYCVL